MTVVETLRIRKLGYALGAEITGVDLSAPLDERTVAEIRAAWLAHIVLCFPGQALDGEGLRSFSRRFGDLDDNRRAPQNRQPGASDEIMVLSNKPLAVEGQTVGGLRNGLFWHTDLSFTDRPATGTFLAAKELPEVGGDTMFANMYMAYETLSPAMQALVAHLEGVHDVTMAEAYKREPPHLQAQDRALNPLVVHPLVRVHPETGRKALYLGNRIRHVVGMTPEESQPFLDFLNAHAVRYEFTYRHRWTLDDVVVWDNRCALHHALADYDLTRQRRMLRCSQLGPKIGRPFETNAPLTEAG